MAPFGSLYGAGMGERSVLMLIVARAPELVEVVEITFAPGVGTTLITPIGQQTCPNYLL